MFGRRKKSGAGNSEEGRDEQLGAEELSAEQLGAEELSDEQGSDERFGDEQPRSSAAVRTRPAEAVTRAPSGRGWRVDGPFDESEVEDPSDGGRRLSLGSLWLAGQAGVELQLQVDQEQGTVEGITFIDGESALEIRAFAAPRSTGIWDDVRAELLASLQEQGAGTEEGDGPFGTELRAALPMQAQNGQQGFQPLRFLGIDGPRWFLRGVISGRGAVEPGAAAALEQVFRDAVVVRGKEPMAPRDPLPLTLPAGAVPAPPPDGAEGSAATERRG